MTEKIQRAATLILFLKNIEVRLQPFVPDIQDRAFRVFTKILDSIDKTNGIVERYDEAILNDDGTVTPFNGTLYLLSLLKVTEEDRKKVWEY